MAGATIKLYKETKGAPALSQEITAFLTGQTVGAGDGSDDVTSTFRSSGQMTPTEARDFVRGFNRLISNFKLPENNLARDPFIAKHVRTLLGLQQVGESYEWFTEVTGGVAAAMDDHFDIGQRSSSPAGFAEFRVSHRPFWYRSNDAIDGTTLPYSYNNSTSNTYGIDLTGVSDNGDLPAHTKLYLRNTGNSISRAYLGAARGVGSYATSKLVTYTAKTVIGSSSAVELNTGGTNVTLTNYPSGYARVLVRMDSKPTVQGLQISTDLVNWFDVEQNHAIARGGLIRLPVSRVASVSASTYSLSVYARYINTTSSTSFPAGDIHLFPCDQFVDYRSYTAIAATQLLIDNGLRNVAYLSFGGSGLFNSVARRGIPFQFANDTYNVTALVEESDGSAPSAHQYGLAIGMYPRRRNI